MNSDQWMPLLVALAGSAGLWSYLSMKSKQAHEKALADKEDRAEFNDTLKEQVERLSAKVDVLIREKEELLNTLAEIKAELAESRAERKHLEEIIRMRKHDR